MSSTEIIVYEGNTYNFTKQNDGFWYARNVNNNTYIAKVDIERVSAFANPNDWIAGVIFPSGRRDILEFRVGSGTIRDVMVGVIKSYKERELNR